MLRSFAIRAGDKQLHKWDLLLTDTHIAAMTAGELPYGVIKDGAIAIADGRIAWIGPSQDLPENTAKKTRSLAGKWTTPALIDCHTHLVFAGDRAKEFEQRLNGASYAEIAAAGGGIMSTVNATRSANFGELLSQTKRRLDVLQAEGCGTVEIKSGYGLNLATELTMLEVVRELGNRAEISVVSTFLGAHTVPIEFKNDSDGYIDLVCNEMLPAVHEKKLADAVDAFCETIAFSTAQLARVFSKAQDLSLPVKLHADQLSDGGGAALAAEFNATSADHLEYTSAAGVSALADAGTVAVMLPGAFLTLGETQLPPIEQFRDHNVPIAIATDCNPGSSPICSLRTTMALATSLFKLTPEECLAGVTRNAATALGLGSDRGTLEIGKRADLAIWDINHPQVLSYWIGSNELSELLVAGMPV